MKMISDFPEKILKLEVLIVKGEIFSEIALKIKEKSPLEKTYAIVLANGYRGYMPTEKEFIEGDYEVDGCKYSPKAESVCIESSLTLINRIEE